MTARITLATRLHASQPKGGEPYQVANYGIGGVYNHHTDSNGVDIGSTKDGAHYFHGDREGRTE